MSDWKLAFLVHKAISFFKKRQEMQKKTHNKQCESPMPFEKWQFDIHERQKNDAEWLPGRVSSNINNQEHTSIGSPNGGQERRNRVHLKANCTFATKIGNQQIHQRLPIRFQWLMKKVYLESNHWLHQQLLHAGEVPVLTKELFFHTSAFLT